MAEYVQQISGFGTEPTAMYSSPSTGIAGINVLQNVSFSRSLQTTSAISNNYIATFNAFNDAPTAKYSSQTIVAVGLNILSNVVYGRSLQVTDPYGSTYIQTLGVNNVVGTTSRVQFWSEF